MMRLPFLAKPRREFPPAQAFPYVELRGGTTRVVLVPALGGKVAELWMAGRQWFWHSTVTPFAPAADPDTWAETGDSGGMDECFPTIGACRVPGWVRGFGGVQLPEHGEVWAQAPRVDVRTSPEGQVARCHWTGQCLPYRLERMVRVDASGVVHFEYLLQNDGTERLPFVWAAHPQFPLTDDTRILLPEGSRLRVFARHGIELGEVRSEHVWPHVRGGARAFDFADPARVARKYACKLFLDVTEGSAVLRERGHELRLGWDASEVPHLGVWINRRGWTPYRDEPPYENLSLQPALAAPDTLNEALGDWRSAAWVEAGAERRWGFRMAASEVPPEG